MHDFALLGLRVTLGGYLAVHGAQKLFGSFDGPGLDKASVGFDHLGLRPGRAFAILAGCSELGGGMLTAAGVANPLGPVAIAGAMAVASVTHADKGPMLQKGGFELPAINLAAAMTLLGVGPGRYSLDRLLGLRLPNVVSRLGFLGAAALSSYSAAQVVQTKLSARHSTGSPATTKVASA
ncbi:MAG: DoxX family protein [Acidimicrobiales bacterium]|jgi:putative oxidoreductase